jgi:hypothetical protein
MCPLQSLVQRKHAHADARTFMRAADDARKVLNSELTPDMCACFDHHAPTDDIMHAAEALGSNPHSSFCKSCVGAFRSNCKSPSSCSRATTSTPSTNVFASPTQTRLLRSSTCPSEKRNGGKGLCALCGHKPYYNKDQGPLLFFLHGSAQKFSNADPADIRKCKELCDRLKQVRGKEVGSTIPKRIAKVVTAADTYGLSSAI